MFASQKLNRGLAPLALAVVVACAFSACKKDAEGEAAPAAAAQQAAPAPTPEDVVADSVAAMSPDQLRSEASKAYGENRLYAPAGNNAVEFYLALRDKVAGDAGASSALIDLLPMTVIATEQGITREDFAEAKRLAALIEKADAQHPALSRLKSAIASSEIGATRAKASRVGRSFIIKSLAQTASWAQSAHGMGQPNSAGSSLPALVQVHCRVAGGLKGQMNG